MKDPFEAACEDQESPPESPIQPAVGDAEEEAAAAAATAGDTVSVGIHYEETTPPPPPLPPMLLPQQQEEEDEEEEEEEEETAAAAAAAAAAAGPSSSSTPRAVAARVTVGSKRKEPEEDQEEEEENVNMQPKVSSGAAAAAAAAASSGDPDKMAKMQAILSQFTEEQMSRYESFRRSGFQKSNMKKLLASIIGSQKISVPMTIVVSGIAKMFVGELVETSRTIMMERKESGPIRPSHIREAYRRLKLEGKIPRRSVPRLFR